MLLPLHALQPLSLPTSGGAILLVVPQPPSPPFDVEALRARIPALRSGTAFFDGPGGTQTPDVVADAIRDALLAPLSNRGTVTEAARNADAVVLGCRAALGDLLHVEPATVVLGRSMTALTFDVARALAREWRAGDEVVVTRLDHDADVTPWRRAAEGVGATVRQADFDPSTGELPIEAIRAQLSERTRLVAVTAASNLIGTMPDVAGIAAEVHAAGALLFVDGVHYAAHALVDVPALGADLFACSPYKFLGPHCGVLTGRPEVLAALRPDRLVVSSDAVPERFELGTLPYELMAGVTAAVDLLASLLPGDGPRRERLARSMAAVEAHETALLQHLESGLDGFEQVTRHSRAARRTPTVLVSIADRAEPALSRFLADRGVNAPSGHFYAAEAAERLGLGSAGGLRIGLAPYTDGADVDRLLSAFEEWFRGH